MEVKLKESEQWAILRDKLNQNCDYDQYWEAAIALFDNRLREKFFDPVQMIIARKSVKGAGFTIVAVQCALIETFAAFLSGKIFNHDRNNPASRHEYHSSKNMFISLLHNAEIFRDHFWHFSNNGGRILDMPYNTLDFYSNVRCGLMHEARTKQNWTINSPRLRSVKTASRFIVTEDGVNKIYRTILHYKLLEHLENYKGQLRHTDRKGRELRKKFARKLDHLFDYAPDNNYIWWL